LFDLRKLIPPLFAVADAPDLACWVGALVREKNLIVRGERVLAAVSGGPDSVALLHLLVRHSQEEGFEVGVAHFDHDLRGQESSDDAGFTARLAQELGLPFYLGRDDVRSSAREKKISLQMAGRELRLQFLRETCRSLGYDKLALGHTADDQVELFFLRVLRGAGLEGLKGMRFSAPDGVVRPLLGVGKEVILAWLARESLPYREDQSNLNHKYLRNRVRLQLLPELARRYNPQVKTAVWRLMSLLEEDECLLASQTAQAFNRVGRLVTPDFVAIDVPSLLELPVGLQKRTVRHALGKLSSLELTSSQVENLRDLANAQKSGGQIRLHSCGAARAGRELHFWRGLPSPPGTAATIITAPGEKDIAPGWRFSLNFSPHTGDCLAEAPVNIIYADQEQGALPLAVRYARAGDRFRPLGAPGTRKLQDVLIDRKIPRWLRPHLPLVESRGRIIWVMGLGPAEPVKVTPATPSRLCLRVSPINPVAARVWEMLQAWQDQGGSAKRFSKEEPSGEAFPLSEKIPC
jgi:tRNA(Ile)-lysidine synthase